MYELKSKKYWADPYLPIQFEYRDPEPAFPLHAHDFHEIAFIFSGKGTHLTIDEVYEVQSGDVLSIKPGQVHGYKNIRALILMNILVKPSFFMEDYFDIQSLPGYQALFGEESQDKSEKDPITHFKMDFDTFLKAKTLIESAYREMNEQPTGYRVSAASQVLHFLILLLRNYGEKNSGKISFGADAAKLFDYVKENYRQSLCMEDLIKVSGMSASHILRVFKHHIGYSPFVYINRLRVLKARDYLIQTTKPITDIALDLGYNDSNYFSRCFKKYSGFSPREYRDNTLKETLRDIS
ncbi:AraC family transcriptional regulator [Spirochaetia bacterium]|nr:AraC family transcriptional regulator [Spirochaetia bacterium]GHV54138.1 AraC family transcriptional regulator [Spirochaetia bacterium]